jgi:uncharacterized protein (TIGR02118 family)
MVRFIVIWKNRPTDVEAFYQRYRQVRIPLGKSLPGVRRYTLSVEPQPVRGEQVCAVAQLDWDDGGTAQQAFASETGKALSVDVDGGCPSGAPACRAWSAT